MDKGMSIDDCFNKADELIKKNGICLLLFDVKSSKKHNNRQKLQHNLYEMVQDFNFKFEEYFPRNKLATYIYEEKGFTRFLGDASWAGINNPKVIYEITDYQKEKYSDISLRWGVAKDGFDSENVKIVK